MTCQHCDKNFVCDVTGCAMPLVCPCECHYVSDTAGAAQIPTINNNSE